MACWGLLAIAQSPEAPNLQQATRALAGDVAALVAAGQLSAGNGSALGAKLDAAAAQFARGNTTAAVNQLEAFIRQVTDLVNSEELSATDGQSLIDAANRIIRAAHHAAASRPCAVRVMVGRR